MKLPLSFLPLLVLNRCVISRQTRTFLILHQLDHEATRQQSGCHVLLYTNYAKLDKSVAVLDQID